MINYRSNDFVTWDIPPTGDPLTGPTYGRVVDTADFYWWDGAAWIAIGGSTTLTTISPSQLTSDQDNYNPTNFGTATYVRLSSDIEMRAITGLVDDTGGIHEKTLINVGSYMIYFPMDHPDSTAANRFTGYPSDYYLYPGQSSNITYDVTSSRWRILGQSAGLVRSTVSHSMSAGSVTAADYGNYGILASGTGSSFTPIASTTTLPATNQGSTGTTTTGSAINYFVKSALTFSAFASAHNSFEAIISLPVLSDGTETYTFQMVIGASPATSTLANSNIMGIRYSNGINSGKFEGFTRDAAPAETTVDLGITVAAATVYKLRIEIDKAKTEVRFYINSSYVGRVTGTMPSSVATGVRIGIFKSAGTTARLLNLHSMSAGAIYPY